MEQKLKMYNTGADYALAVIGGKWKSVILYLLAGHPRRPSELVKQLGTSYKVLSDQLREMTDAGLVVRKSFNTIPPHVEYRLSEEGENLYAALRYLNYWGEARAKKTSNIKIMCTDQMKQAGNDGLCVITKKHLHHWKQEIVKKDQIIDDSSNADQ
ncbi:helix-turn-helix transcriptional regulator [Limosilactobacillus sp. STM2_1]|uniref:Helix-turn-helix transcriptional regulator n=1 Tax=Limosilactobacillus rudii TaxID=2759755 RepID=A0A7W3UKP0_9LACO|nr:helix-turn-helix domain-containing protein [Limosilactobacillus rudii]MBB1079250.1 helix-turn-helix transcriptional regulator [Limosilactobacillus rudii]MBB1097339.1 helix-turn-helix transcriptional regulator [Limosilactobacillus rudii]MCD7134448.1 helix-turn-helix transcriptional regulator [Limosilactobacillus rudii]